MDDYKEMGLLYEAFARAPKSSPDTTRSYPASDSKHSLGHQLPTTIPGGSINAAAIGISSSKNNAGVCDEETDMSTFMKSDVIKKIDSLMNDAESFEDTKTMIALNELKRFIERL
tara:strand:+ start:932 stop:1276 length:345 start_codon:yes stop_codon:yes gene_type:complete